MTLKTKDIITKTLWDLVRERPVDKITVKDIVERCGINRNTFYYHFRDIPDVVEYAISVKVGELAQGLSKTHNSSEFFLSLLLYLHENKQTVLHIYKSLKRESFVRYLRLLFSYMVQPFRETSSELDLLGSTEKELLLFFTTCLMEGMILEWMESNMDEEILCKAKQASQFFSSDQAKILELLKKKS